MVTYGPASLVERALAGIAGIDEAYIHGSWAARYQGEPGGSPGDVDVLVVGRPSRGQVDAALAGLDERLGREVNVTFLTPGRWRGDDPFVDAVRARPLVGLHPARGIA